MATRTAVPPESMSADVVADIRAWTPQQLELKHAELEAECGRLMQHQKLTANQRQTLYAARDIQQFINDLQLEARHAEIMRNAQDPARVIEPDSGSRETRPSTGDASRDQARRTLDSLRSVPDEGRERLTRLFERAEADPRTHGLSRLSSWLLATSSPDYARAVAKLFRDPENGHREFDARELAAYQAAKQEQRAMAIGTDSAGGFLLPVHLDPQIMLSNAGAVDPIRQLARVVSIATNEWNGVSSAGVTASWDAEAAEVSDDSPTVAQPSVPTHKGAAFIAASIEAAMDTDIGNQVAELFIDAKQRLEATAFLDGSGTGQPTGVITALGAGQKVATATADALVSADVTKPILALPSRWQPNASQLANLATMTAIGAFELANGGLRYPEVADGRLLRKPFLEHSGMETAGTTATAGNDSVLLAGDFKQYLIADRIGTTVEYIPHLFDTANGRPKGQRGWYMFWRTGGDVLIDDAFRLLTA